MVSADLHGMGADGRWCRASVRTRPGLAVRLSAGRWDVEWFGAGNTTASGWLALRPTPGSSDRLTIALHCADDLDGLIAGTTVVIVGAVWTGEALREIALKTEIEGGVRPPQPVFFEPENAVLDAHACLLRAGFAVHRIGDTMRIPQAKDGWGASAVFAALNQLMTSTAQAPQRTPTWEFHLLLLAHARRAGLFGLMFDYVDGLPRQGAAVFVEEIRKRVPDNPDHKIIQTIVHEFGHALNLVHRFSRQVRRPNSTSFMNYDWYYRGGDHAQEYWDRFDFTFDQDEREFLRHAPCAQIIPGGATFGSTRYWAADQDTVAAEHCEDLRLWLTPPSPERVFAYGQPVFLEVSLHNVGENLINVPRQVLDVKAGQLDIVVQGPNPTEATTTDPCTDDTPFVPIMHRCYDLIESDCVKLAPGESLHENVNLVYGSNGFPFTEPGSYRVHPVLTLPAFPATETEDVVLERLVLGPALDIQIGQAQDADEETDARTLFNPAAGVILALGGIGAEVEHLQGTVKALELVRDRRENKTAQDDPVVAAITRVAGIQAGREGRFREAADLLDKATTPQAIGSFDPHTAEHTRRLAAKYRTAAQDGDTGSAPTMVTVDIKVRSRAGGPVQGGRVAGVLIADESGLGWRVLAPTDHLPADLPDGDTMADAMVIAAAADGLSECLRVQRVDLIRSRAPMRQQTCAFLWLSRAIPAPPLPPLPKPMRELDPDPGSAGDLWETLATLGVAPANLSTIPAEVLSQCSQAADMARTGVHSPVPLPIDVVHVVAVSNVLASILCWFTNSCLDLPLPHPVDPCKALCAGKPAEGATYQPLNR